MEIPRIVSLTAMRVRGKVGTIGFDQNTVIGDGGHDLG
jgi:hypothetical protein